MTSSVTTTAGTHRLSAHVFNRAVFMPISATGGAGSSPSLINPSTARRSQRHSIVGRDRSEAAEYLAHYSGLHGFGTARRAGPRADDGCARQELG